ncbi:RHS repeat-associated core domain-containing protein [Kitasatospora sp. NPDC088134]|uniref:RHS repeat domain-containing protein n=1 Tax=Kitasatospora sp. NPDC088134 TaxID=3364071 RepID=UPI0037FE75C5
MLRRAGVVLTGLALLSGVVPGVAFASPQAKPNVPAVPKERQVPYSRAAPGKGSAVASFAKYDPTVASRLPGAGSAVVDLAGAGAGSGPGSLSAEAAPGAVRAGNLPVLVKPVDGPAVAKAAPSPSSKVRVTLTDQSVAQKAGVHGILFSLGTEGGGGRAATVTVDPSSFRSAFGGDYASRLHLVKLPTCALTTPELAECQTQTPVETVPGAPLSAKVDLAPATTGAADVKALSAPWSLPAAGGTVLAATSAPDGSSGSYSATSLAPSGTWTAGGNTGAFSYSYPTKVPAAVAGASPDLSLSYDSSSQDGRTSGTNNQSSWLGDGWSSSESFVERSYKSCTEDKTSGAPAGSGDRCWAGQILTLALNGKSTQIVYDGTSFRPVADSGTEKVERLFLSGGASNGTYNGEYFRITENGVQYYFGLNQLPGFTTGKQETKSVYTVPVYGAHAGDPCNGPSFAASSCVQGWRWNLDFVVDTHDNAIAYYYQPETNYYGANAQNTGVSYTRGGYLQRIDYGITRTSAYAAVAPEQILFDTAERCVPGTPVGAVCDDAHFTTANAAWWPDVPVDQNCVQGSSCSNHSPSFWSRKRLSRITTQVQVGGATQQVDKWEFTQSFPDGGDHAPTLWLESVQHTGLDTSAGGSAAVQLPPTSFGPPAQLANRVGTVSNQPAMYHDRIQNITTETGARITVTYNPTECTPGNVPTDPADNTMACYPVLWTPPGYSTQQKDWFHKYTVASVRTDDLHTANQDGTFPSLLTSYKYLGGAAWHYDTGELGKDDARTYSQFRGYASVETRTGDTGVFHTLDQANVYDQVTLSKSTYFRGMSHNTADGTGGSTVTLTSQDNAHSVEDKYEFAGRVFETDTYTGDGGSISEATVTIPIVIGPTATRTRAGLRPLTAQMVRDSQVYKRQAVSYGWRVTETDTFYNTTLGQTTTGMPVQTADRGETSAAGNITRCSWTRYAVNSAQVMALPAETITTAQDCPSAGATPSGTLVSDSRTSYDGHAFGYDGLPGAVAPTKGEATLTESAGSSSGATATGYVATAANGYDSLGRLISTTRTPNSTAPDGSSLARSTTTTYTPASGALPTGVVTKVQVTAGATPTYQTSTATLDAPRGLPVEKVDPANLRTSLTYDALGRQTAVWLPTQSKAALQPATMTYGYQVSATDPSAVTTNTLLENGSYSPNVTLYDAMLRVRQVQSTGENASTIVTDTQYDSHGWTVRTNNAYNVSGAPNQVLIKAAQLSIPDSTVTDHDALGRPTATSQEHDGRTPAGMTTRTAYTGDTTVTLPRSGGVAARTVTDARGRTVETGQYTAPPTLTGSATGGWTATGGTRASITYGYNAAGQRSSTTGPDGSVWTTGYDLLGRTVSQTDPDAGTSRFGYDDAGDTVWAKDARNIELDYTYDLLGRKLTAVDKTNGNFKFGVWKYDTLQVGKLSYSARYVPGVTGAYVVQPTGYTSLGKPTGTKITLPASEAPLPTTYTTTYSYSPTTQQLIGQRDPGIAGLLVEDISYGYNALGAPVSAQSLNSYVGPVDYTNYGEIARTTYGPSNNPAWSVNTYDDQTRRLANVQTSRSQSPAGVVDDVTYAYDPFGNPTSTVDKQSESGSTVTDTQCYRYDSLNRLAQAWTAKADCPAAGTDPTPATVATGSAAYWQSFGYDLLGNRTSAVDHAVNGQSGDTSTVYTNGCAGDTTQCPNGPQPHTLTATTSTGPAGTTSTSFTANAIGATAKRAVGPATPQVLGWNSEGRIDSIVQAGSTTKYVYDADGNLLLRRDQGQTLFFAGDTTITVNTATTPNTLLGAVRTYTLAGRAVAQASSLPGGGVHYLLSDQQGTMFLSMDTTTQQVVRKQQTPYGQPRGASTGWPDPTRGFLAKPYSTATGYTDVGARIYDPVLGRFLSADPVFDPTDLSQLGGFAYAGSNPLTGSDPSGLYCDGCNWDTEHGNSGGKGKGPYSDGGPCEAGDFLCYQYKIQHPSNNDKPRCGDDLLCQIHNGSSGSQTTDPCAGSAGRFCGKYGPYPPIPTTPTGPSKQTTWENRYHTDPAKGAEPIYSDSPNFISRWFHRTVEAFNTPIVAQGSAGLEGLAILTGSDCGQQFGMQVCSGGWMAGATTSNKGGFTFGFVYFSKSPDPRPQEIHHESVHRRQYLDYGPAAFLLTYFGQAPVNGIGCNNTIEQEAGLDDGNYCTH